MIITNELGTVTNIPVWQDSIPPYCPTKAKQAVSVAESYFNARVSGRGFAYSKPTFLSRLTNRVNDADGKGLIDCSTYIHLVMRGIRFEQSPYGYKDASEQYPANYTLSNEVSTNPGYYWADDSLRKSYTLSNTIFTKTDGRLVRTAADLAKYYFASGRTFPYYSCEIDGVRYCDMKKYIRPGDLLFYDAHIDTEERFLGIDHVGIVQDEELHVLNVTSNSEVVTQDDFSDREQEVILVARPFYEVSKFNARRVVENYIEGNFLYDGRRKYNHVIAMYDAMNGTIWTGTENGESATGARQIWIADETNPIYLPPGTYRLSGAPAHKDRRAVLGNLLWGLRAHMPAGVEVEFKEFGYSSEFYEGDIVSRIQMANKAYDRGYGMEFSIAEATMVKIDIYISHYVVGRATPYANEDPRTDIWRPYLERIE